LLQWLNAVGISVRRCPKRGAPEEVAGGIVFIAPDQASDTAGQILNVDGGHAAR